MDRKMYDGLCSLGACDDRAEAIASGERPTARDLLWGAEHPKEKWEALGIPYPTKRQWSAAVRRAPEMALKFAAPFLARTASVSAWSDAVQYRPVTALEYAVPHLARVVPAKVWASVVQRRPFTALEFATRHLAHVVPAAVWEEVVRAAPDSALEFATRHLAGVAQHI